MKFLRKYRIWSWTYNSVDSRDLRYCRIGNVASSVHPTTPVINMIQRVLCASETPNERLVAEKIGFGFCAPHSGFSGRGRFLQNCGYFIGNFFPISPQPRERYVCVFYQFYRYVFFFCWSDFEIRREFYLRTHLQPDSDTIEMLRILFSVQSQWDFGIINNISILINLVRILFLFISNEIGSRCAKIICVFRIFTVRVDFYEIT